MSGSVRSPDARTREVLAFEVEGQRFGLWSADVREVLPAVAVTQLCGAPAVVEGVINVRGEVVPVLGFRARLGLPPKRLEHTDHFVVASGPRCPVALRVDRATELLAVRASDVEAAERVWAGVRSVAGVVKLPDGLLVVHDLSAFLTESESAALEEALRPPEPPER